MIATVYPGKLSGTVRVPASKSMAHRLLICAALADAPTEIEISALNNDITATMDCLKAMGAKIEQTGSLYRITPASDIPEKCTLDCGESGSTLRFLIPVTAALGTSAAFTGKGRLPQRPNIALTDAMKAHGTSIDSDLLPMNVSGGMQPGTWSLPGNVSSQYITGLMFALPLLDGDSDIVLTTHLESASYIEMTLRAVSRFGISIDKTETGWHIPGNQKYISPGRLEVEGDWSAAAFWMAANAMGSTISISGLDPDTTQGDRAAEFLMGNPAINAENVPDLVPALAVCAAVQPYKTVITGAARLRIKESDRLAAIADMLKGLSAGVTVTDDGLIIEGAFSDIRNNASDPSAIGIILPGIERTSPLSGGDVNGMNDHRIVMAAAIAATCAESPVTITDAEAVSKSYPDFFRDFELLGGKVHVQ